MTWAVILVALIIAAFAIPRLGKALLVLLAVVVVIAAAVGLVLYIQSQREQAARDLAKTFIRASEIELVDLVLLPSHGTGSFRLAGRIRNRSVRYTLTGLQLRLTMRDCSAPNDCEVVGQTSEDIYAAVPPGQARELDESVSFAGLGRPRGEHKWDFAVTEVSGREAGPR
jgi:hypothetical protein